MENFKMPLVVGVVQSLSRIRLLEPHELCLPGSSVHGILQAVILERVAIAFSIKYPWRPAFSYSWFFPFVKINDLELGVWIKRATNLPSKDDMKK